MENFDRVEFCRQKFHELFGGEPAGNEGTDPEFMRILQIVAPSSSERPAQPAGKPARFANLGYTSALHLRRGLRGGKS